MLLTRRRTMALAWPIMLSNAAAPLVGLVDTFAIGRTGDATALAAVALGALIFTFLYWSVGFLRMGTTGIAAQALGASNEDVVQATLARAAPVGFAIGLFMLAMQPVISWVVSHAFDTSAAVADAADLYILARIWGAPAALANFAVVGWFIALQRTRLTMALQLTMNGINAALCLVLVVRLQLGPAGAGFAAAIADWITLLLGLALAVREMRRRGGIRRTALLPGELFRRSEIIRLFAVNRDIFIRTVAILLAMCWFANAGAAQGTAVLAANQVLLQLAMAAGFALDAFAFIVEAEVGQAVGARNPNAFDHGVTITSQCAIVCGVLAAIILLTWGDTIVALLVDDPAVLSQAAIYLPWSSLFCAFMAVPFQLDGIFIGATRGAAMRNSGVASLLIYLSANAVLAPLYGNHGVWLAFVICFVARSITLGMAYPSLRRSLA